MRQRMKSIKALVVEHDEKTRQVIDEVLLAIGHKYEVATSLAEARELLAANGYAYVLLNCMIPARPGGTPRRQNAENFLDDLRKIKGHAAPPVVIMFDSMPEADDEIKVSWACDMTLRGVKRFIRKPFKTEGRTLDRVIKKVLAGEMESMRFVDVPIIRLKERQEAAASNATVGPSPEAPRAPQAASDLKANVAAAALPADAPAAPPVSRWTDVSNEPVTIDDFMAKFCELRTQDNRVCRKRALLAAARHGTVKLPPLAGERKHGQPNRYFVHDLLWAWQGFLGEGVDLPTLLPEHRLATSVSDR